MTDPISASPAGVRKVLARLEAERQRVTRLPSGGLDVRAASPRFEGSEENARRLLDEELAQDGLKLPPGSLVWLRGPTLEPEDIALLASPRARRPTWADALLLEPEPSTVPDDREFGSCKAVAFWGLKGGVGRTTALAHVASLMGRRRRILAVDLDLDSPGLVATLCPSAENSAGRFDRLLVRAADATVTDAALLSDVGNTIRAARDDASGVWVLGPAAADVEFVQRLLGPLTPAALYRPNVAPLRRVLRLAIQSVSADIILLDARSGYCDESAMAVLDLADEVIIFASPARSTFASITPAVHALERTRRSIGRPAKVRFVAGMLPADEALRAGIKDELLASAEEARAQVTKELETPPVELPADVEILAVEYSSRIVDNEGRLVHGVIDGYRDLAERLDPREVPPEIVAAVTSTDVKKITTEVEIPPPQAEDEKLSPKLAELFTVTSKLRDFARHEVSLVLGAKGTGKSFLRRMCLQEAEQIIRRSGMASLAQTRFLEVYAGGSAASPIIDAHALRTLDEGKPDWSALWSAIALVRVAAAQSGFVDMLEARASHVAKALKLVLAADLPSTLIPALRKLAKQQDLSAAWRYVDEEGARIGKTICLVFDQLDVALGSSTTNRVRRKALIEGLLEAHGQWQDRRHIGAKIFLREDLWDETELEEKAKYASRSVVLTWTQEELWRLCVRAFGVGSKTFADYLYRKMGIDVSRLEEATENQQEQALALIWGTRMSGKDNDTFSTSWVYRRLHDGRERLFPRAALWLLRFSVEEQKNSGLRDTPPLLAPEALRKAMPKVAEQRLTELKSEASDDRKLVDALKGFRSYQDEKAFKASLAQRLGSTPALVSEEIERLMNIGVLERGSRRDGKPTLRIVDLYAFAPSLEIERLGRR